MRKLLLSGNTFQSALVDDEDYDRLVKFSWYLNKDGYARTYLEGHVEVFMHSMLINCVEVDHRDRNPLNYQKDNLRACSTIQNRQNRGLFKNSSTGYKGVSKKGLNYRARIAVNRRNTLLGMFSSKEDAARAYNEAAIKYFGEFACLNEIESI